MRQLVYRSRWVSRCLLSSRRPQTSKNSRRYSFARRPPDTSVSLRCKPAARPSISPCRQASESSSPASFRTRPRIVFASPAPSRRTAGRPHRPLVPGPMAGRRSGREFADRRRPAIRSAISLATRSGAAEQQRRLGDVAPCGLEPSRDRPQVCHSSSPGALTGLSHEDDLNRRLRVTQGAKHGR
jgi:hypothetical protein